MTAVTRQSRKMRAFSLAELLIVIGIIAVLIALLLPGVSKIRQQARAAQCVSNLGQIYKAQLAWKAEHTRDKDFNAYQAQGWMSFLQPYLASADATTGQVLPAVYFCPNDDRALVSGGTPATNGTAGTGGTGGGTGGTGTGGGGSTAAILPQNLAVRWHSVLYGIYDTPLAPGPRVRATVISTNPNSYRLEMEQEPATTTENLDYNDAVFTLTDNPDGTSNISLANGDGSYVGHALYGELIDVTTQRIIWPQLYRPGGTQIGAVAKMGGSLPSVSDLGNPSTGGTSGGTGSSASKTIAHYGINNAIDRIMGHGDKVLGMDYLVDLIQVEGSQADDWLGATWINDSDGVLRFARHNKEVNVLFGDGSVKNIRMLPTDKTWGPWENYQAGLAGIVGPYLMTPVN